MFKLKSTIIIILSLFIIMGCFKSDEEKRQDKVNKILLHMEKEYGEKFYMSSPFGGRGKNDALRIMVKPVRYKGTSKEYDKFYEDYAFIKTDGKTGDGFGTVYLKEGAEKYFKPKLKELFGENIIIAIEPEGYYEKWNFKEEMKRRKKVYDNYPDGRYSPLSGGIYIFGRVETEEDREYYRKQIYEFIQYLKAENMFDYVNITLSVTDERLLSKEFNQSNDKIILDNMKGGSEKYAYINRLMPKYSRDFEKTSQEYKDRILNKKIKTNMFEDLSENAVFLLHSRIRSKKYIKSRKLDEDKRFNAKIKLYENVDEVEFIYEDYKLR